MSEYVLRVCLKYIKPFQLDDFGIEQSEFLLRVFSSTQISAFAGTFFGSNPMPQFGSSSVRNDIAAEPARAE